MQFTFSGMLACTQGVVGSLSDGRVSACGVCERGETVTPWLARKHLRRKERGIGPAAPTALLNTLEAVEISRWTELTITKRTQPMKGTIVRSQPYSLGEVLG